MKNIIVLVILFLQIILSVYSQEMLINRRDGTVFTTPISDIDSIWFFTVFYTDTMNVPCSGTPTVTDADGNVYNTVQIGTQCWMAKNLNVGTMITSDTSGSLQTDNGTIEKYCYDNVSANCDTFGGLYEWQEMMQFNPSDYGTCGSTQGICPTNWHVPTDNEWKNLEMYLGMTLEDSENTAYRGGIEGGRLKATGTAFWNAPNYGALNNVGFTALPGGRRSSSGTFNDLKKYGHYWSSTEFNSIASWYRELRNHNATAKRGQSNKLLGLSIRCIKNY